MSLGIVSLQAKEAKHSGVKEDLTLTNRSNVSTATGKWWQIQLLLTSMEIQNLRTPTCYIIYCSPLVVINP